MTLAQPVLNYGMLLKDVRVPPIVITVYTKGNSSVFKV